MSRFLVLFFFIAQLNAQSSIVSGFISDSSSGEALIGANVILQETGQGMATDINGYYIIQDIVPGNYILMVSYVGFSLSKKTLNISEGESIKLNVSLAEEVVELSQIEVSAEQLQRSGEYSTQQDQFESSNDEGCTCFSRA